MANECCRGGLKSGDAVMGFAAYWALVIYWATVVGRGTGARVRYWMPLPSDVRFERLFGSVQGQTDHRAENRSSQMQKPKPNRKTKKLTFGSVSVGSIRGSVFGLFVPRLI
jgi:hypothetical protein